MNSKEYKEYQQFLKWQQKQGYVNPPYGYWGPVRKQSSGLPGWATVSLIVGFIFAIVMFAQAFGFGLGGGEVDILSPESHAEVIGNNGVAVAVNGDRNDVAWRTDVDGYQEQADANTPGNGGWNDPGEALATYFVIACLGVGLLLIFWRMS